MIGRNSMSQRSLLPITVALALIGPRLATAAPPGAHPAKSTAKPKPAPARKPATAAKPDADVHSAPRNNTWALLVGVSKYQNPAILSLRYPASHATSIRD